MAAGVGVGVAPGAGVAVGLGVDVGVGFGAVVGGGGCCATEPPPYSQSVNPIPRPMPDGCVGNDVPYRRFRSHGIWRLVCVSFQPVPPDAPERLTSAAARFRPSEPQLQAAE